MYKMLIVDDEKWVAESIKNSIDWDKNDCNLIGIAYDGIEAMEIIKKEVPDIVITDIRMPRMNGLELINMVNNLNLDTKFIIVSGYAEFSYAQKALNAGAFGYCLKPIVRYEINELVDKLKTIIDKVKKETLIFDSLLYNSTENMEITKKILTNNGICCDERNGIVIVISTGVGILKIKECSNITVKMGCSKYIYFIQHKKQSDIKKILFSKLKDNIKSIGISSIIYELEGLSEAIEEANLASFQYFITGSSGIYEYKKSENSEIKDLMHNLNKAIQDKDVTCLKKIYEKTETIFKTGRYDIKQAFRFYNSVINSMLSYDEEDKENYLYSFQQLVNKYTDIVKMLEDLYDSCLIHLNEKHEEKYYNFENDTMNNIIKYVNENFCSDISIQDLSQRFHINSNYMSQLFKKEIGKNYIDYITNLRVKYACDLLTKSVLTLPQIADRVGYNDYFYFSKVFKKYTGKTPSKYKQDLNSKTH